jgi:hypothetical protein
VQGEVSGQLVSASWTPKLAEKPEEPRARWLGERVLGSRPYVHQVEFRTVPLGKLIRGGVGGA